MTASCLVALLLAGTAGLVIAADPPAQPSLEQAMPSDQELVLPIYKPRKESSPRARIEGASRGSESGEPLVVALVPDHVGLTFKNDSSLCWYLSKMTSLPLTLTVLESRAIRPALETTLPPPQQAGFHCIHLKDHGFSLKEREQYRWFISVTVDPNNPSRDIVTGGMIERIPFDEACALDLPCSWTTCEGDSVRQYGQAGLWYDAITCLLELLQATPDDRLLREMLDHLLKQSDLHLPGRV